MTKFTVERLSAAVQKLRATLRGNGIDPVTFASDIATVRTTEDGQHNDLESILTMLDGRDGSLAPLAEIDHLRHLTRDLHLVIGEPAWRNASDNDGDLAQLVNPTGAIPPDTVLKDSDFDNNGAYITLPGQHTQGPPWVWRSIWVRLPATTDVSTLRIVISGGTRGGNALIEVEGPSPASYKYYYATNRQLRGDDGDAQLQVRDDIADSAFGGELTGEALMQLLAYAVHDREELPDPNNYDVDDVTLAMDRWHKLGITSGAAANQFDGTVGTLTYRIARENWRGISSDDAPGIFTNNGSWQANPGNALSLLVASDGGHIRMAVKRSAFEAAKGSDFATGDKIAIDLALESGGTDRAVLNYYSGYQGFTEPYIEFQARKDSGDFGLASEASGHVVHAKFFAVDSDGNATTTPFLTHPVDEKHWLDWAPIPAEAPPPPSTDEDTLGPEVQPHTSYDAGMDGPSLAFLNGKGAMWMVRRVQDGNVVGAAGVLDEWILTQPDAMFPPAAEFKQLLGDQPTRGGISAEFADRSGTRTPYMFSALNVVDASGHVRAQRFLITEADDIRDGLNLTANTDDWGDYVPVRYAPGTDDAAENDVIRDLVAFQEGTSMADLRFWMLNETKGRIHNLKGVDDDGTHTLVTPDDDVPYVDLPATTGTYGGMGLQQIGRDRILHVWHQQSRKTVAYDVTAGEFYRAPDYDLDMTFVDIPNGAYAGGLVFNGNGRALYTSFWDKDSSDNHQFRPNAATSVLNRRDVNFHEFGRIHLATAIGHETSNGVVAEAAVVGEPPVDLIKEVRLHVALSRYNTDRVPSDETGTLHDRMRPIFPAISRSVLITEGVFIEFDANSATRETEADAAIAEGRCITFGASAPNNVPRMEVGKTQREAGGTGGTNDWWTRARVILWRDAEGRFIRVGLADVHVNSGDWWYNWVTIEDVEVDLLDDVTI